MAEFQPSDSFMKMIFIKKQGAGIRETSYLKLSKVCGRLAYYLTYTAEVHSVSESFILSIIVTKCLSDKMP